jgi:outer membrane receptor protein involved in Fe transport
MYNEGKMSFPGEETVPLRHTHPARGLIILSYRSEFRGQEIWLIGGGEIVGKYTRIEKSRLMSDPGYLDNPQDPASGLYRVYGLPGYTLLFLRSGASFSKAWSVTLAVENIGDVRYRSAHSRMDGPGRNIQVSISWTPEKTFSGQ